MILVHGKSHAAQHLRMAAKVRDNHLTELWSLADVFFYSLEKLFAYTVLYTFSLPSTYFHSR